MTRCRAIPPSIPTPWTSTASVLAAAFLQCIGPSSMTVRWPSEALTSFCVAPGGLNENVDAVGPITVEATGDTSWRVVIYSQ